MRTQKRWRRGRAAIAMVLCAGILFGKFAGGAPAAPRAAQEGTIIASSLYVRSGPSTSYSKMTVNGQDVYLTKNTEVEILGEENGWYRITATFSGKEVTGYVSGKYVSVEAAPTKAPASTPTTKPTPTKPASTGALATEFSVPAQIWVTELNIRQSAGTSGALLDTLKSGASVTVIGETYAGTEKWYKITYVSGGKTITGYAYAPYVTLNAPIPTATPKPVATPTPAPAQSGNYADEFSVKARVTASVLNVRSGAGTSNSLVATLRYGLSVTATGVTSVNGETWYRITFEDGGVKKVGYVYGPYITLDGAIPTATPKPTATPVPTATPTPVPTSAPTVRPDGLLKDYEVPATVIVGMLNVRAQAGTNSDIVAVLVNTTKVTATGSCYVGNDKWYCIELTMNGEKKEGYVFGEYIQLSAPEPTKAPTSTPEPTKVSTTTPEPTSAPVIPETGVYAFPAKVSANQLNLRSGAGTEHAALKMLVLNEQLVVTGEEWKGTDKWYRVSVGELEGFALSDFIRLDFEIYPDAVLTEQTRLRSGASKSSSYVKNQADAIVVLPKGCMISLTGEQTANDGKWFAISCDLGDEVVKGFIPADAVKFGKPTVTPTPTPAPTATPTPEATVTPTPEATPTVAPTSAPAPTPTKAPEATATPKVTPTPTATKAPTATPAPSATPAAEAKENTEGKQVGWGHAVHPSASSMVLKTLPKSGASSVKSSTTGSAITVKAEDYLMLYDLYVDESGKLYRHVGITRSGNKYYGYILDSYITPCAAPVTATPTPIPLPGVTAAPGVTQAPSATPTQGVKPWTDAKENTKGEQVGWGHATHSSASSLVLKVLPKNGVSSVKTKDGGRAITVTSGTYLMLYGLYEDEKGNLYRHVGVEYSNSEYYGYVLDKYITECAPPVTPAPFPGIDIWGDQNDNNQGVSADFELNLTLQRFPESYKPYLRALNVQYPNWVFKAYHTNLNWDTAIKEENIPGKNLIPNSYGIAWKSLEEGAYNWKTDSFIVYDGSTWVTASKAALEYYMDPRNFLDDKSIFQFEVLAYEPSYQDLAGVENILKYTPLYQSTYVYKDQYGQLKSISYAETFLKAAEYSGVSPYHLATRVKQEVVTGTSTVSNSVTGTVAGYEGLYNFYNIGAYHSTQPGGAIANGLKYAKYGSSTNDELNDASLIPWDNRYSAIVGGAYIIGSSYINRGQDTIYLQKFNMTSTYTYSHQYMANVVAPSSEGKKTAQAYTGAVDSPIVFSIPVFLNMPAGACPEPTTAYNPNNYLSKLSVKTVDGTTCPLTPSFDGTSTTTYSIIVENSTEVIQISATPVSKKAVVSGDGYQTLAVGRNELTVCVIAEDGSKREYVLYVVREE